MIQVAIITFLPFFALSYLTIVCLLTLYLYILQVMQDPHVVISFATSTNSPLHYHYPNCTLLLFLCVYSTPHHHFGTHTQNLHQKSKILH